MTAFNKLTFETILLGDFSLRYKIASQDTHHRLKLKQRREESNRIKIATPSRNLTSETL